MDEPLDNEVVVTPPILRTHSSRSMRYPRRVFDFVQTCAPPTNPVPWLFINAACCGWSLWLLFWVALHTGEGPLERHVSFQLYYAWNFGTVFIWCFQVALIIAVSPKISWVRWIELALALYFWVDSILMVRQKDDDNFAMEYLDLSLSATAYFYELWMDYREVMWLQNRGMDLMVGSNSQEDYCGVDDVSPTAAAVV